ncbi:MAG: discoidin domain-containing protein [Anaerolineales bacterium]|nr:discoidin domain-containing protein [Anaerolineales bacterium]
MIPRRPTYLLTTLVVLLLAACSRGEPDLLESYTVRPITDIVDTDLIVTNFARDGSATLPIDTRVPVACTVVYGETPEFGRLTLDQDMAGGTHSEHNPLLTGLEPETTYYFRAQGLDDDGILYVSEVMTFTTPAQAAAPIDNLASPDNGAVISGVSSAFGGAGVGERWGAGSAFDDNPNSEWSSAGDGDAAWIEVELADRANIERIEFQTRSMSDGSAITLAFVVTTDEGLVFGPFDVPDAGKPYSFEVDMEARTLRFDLVQTTGGNTGAVDIGVFGSFIE